MGEYTRKCKYCGSNINGGLICNCCKTKLNLIRRLLGMVKDAKAQVVQDNKIRAYLRESA